MRDGRSRNAVEVAERYAKSFATASELRSAFDQAMDAADRDSDNGQEAEAAAAAANPELHVEAAAYAAAWAKANRAGDAAEIDPSAHEEFTRELFRAERAQQAKLLRAIAASFAPESPASLMAEREPRPKVDQGRQPGSHA
jgi:hypothetical protein